MTLIHALEACLASLVTGFVCGAVYWNRVKAKAVADLSKVGN